MGRLAQASKPDLSGASKAANATSGATTVSYVRDALDRIVQRKVNGATVARYGYAGSSDSPSFVLDAIGNVIERTVNLPGGVNLSVRAAGNVWSYPNLHGDTAVSATQAGTKIGTTANYDSTGNQTSGTVADNAAGNFDNRWLGQYQRPTETEPGLEPVIEMGARQYSPRIGRFLQTDPITGGSANAYAYVFGDPANVNDLTGKCGECGFLALIGAYYSSGDPMFKPALIYTPEMRRIYNGDIDQYAGGVPHELFEIESIVGKFGEAVIAVVGEISKVKTIYDYAKLGFEYGSFLCALAFEFYPVCLLAATFAGASIGYLQDRYGDPNYELGR